METCPSCKKQLSAKAMKTHGPCTSPPSPDNPFGGEIIEPMLARLHPSTLAAMLKFPEDALTQDLPNLIFFNLDFPGNSTLSVENGQIVAYTRAKFRPLADEQQLLRAMARHFKKVVDHARSSASSLDVAFANEYIGAVDANKDVAISEYCPLFDRVEDGVISIPRLLERVASTVRANCALGREDWVRTRPYVEENFGMGEPPP